MAHVLLVDDNHATRAEMLDYLVRRDVHVTGCSTLAEARAALLPGGSSFGPPDLIACDIRLPDGDGGTSFVQNAGDFPSAKWILMSGNHDLVRLASRLNEVVGLPPSAAVDKPIPMRLMNRFIEEQIPDQSA